MTRVDQNELVMSQHGMMLTLAGFCHALPTSRAACRSVGSSQSRKGCITMQRFHHPPNVRLAASKPNEKAALHLLQMHVSSIVPSTPRD